MPGPLAQAIADVASALDLDVHWLNVGPTKLLASDSRRASPTAWSSWGPHPREFEPRGGPMSVGYGHPREFEPRGGPMSVGCGHPREFEPRGGPKSVG
jgi:hypothetical protein